MATIKFSIEGDNAADVRSAAAKFAGVQDIAAMDPEANLIHLRKRVAPLGLCVAVMEVDLTEHLDEDETPPVSPTSPLAA